MTTSAKGAGGPGGTRRGTYHHGNLRQALIEAAVELARAGGPDAIVLREVARTTGVSSTAAYRHFAGHGELVLAVKDEGLARLARAMYGELDRLTPTGDRAEDAARRLRAVGAGYVRFALAEPGLFRLIFRDGVATAGDEADHPHVHTPEGALAFNLLSEILDDLLASGRLTPERRPNTEIACWAGVHGVATLLLDTKLSELPGEAKDAVLTRTLDVIIDGL